MSIITSPLLLGADSGLYQISRSLRFNAPDSAYLSRTPASAGNRKTWTWAGWIKGLDYPENPAIFACTTGTTDNTYLRFRSIDGAFHLVGYNTYFRSTSAVYRDPSAWYHVVWAVDTTQATAANRVKLYVNGVEVTAFSATNNPTQNDDLGINQTTVHAIGSNSNGAGNMSGYLADIHFIDGQQLDPSSFTTTDLTTGQLIPKAYTGSYGTNGFKLNFSDNSTTAALGTDTSGNGNTWTTNNFSVTAGSGNDSLVDTPTSYGTDTGVGNEVRGNYATLNPLNIQVGAGSLSNGNLDFTGPSGSGAYNFVGGTFGIDTSTSSGWYFEYTQTTYGQFASIALLDQSVSASALNNSYIIGHSSGNQTAGISYSNGGALGNYGTLTTGLTSWTSNGDVIGVAIKDNKIWFAKNNTWISGSPSAGTSPSITLASTKFVTPAAIGINSSLLSLNAGQRAFAYTAPSGFKALVDTNLPTPVVAKGSTAMDVKLYTGNGGTQTISGLGFGPDFVWLKRRDAARNHALYDIVRGVKKYLASDSTSAEYEPASGGVSSFDASSFTVVEQGGVAVNESSASMVAWTWDAGSSTVTNTAGSITSSVRANPSAGFSVVSWTGTSSSGTIGHGLNVAPAMIIVKCRSTGGTGWPVYHQSLGGVDKVITLQSTAAVQTISNYWNTTAPSSTTFGVASGYDNNVNGATMIAYAFSPVSGYSAMGSYEGTSGTGAFVWTGMRPRWLLVKKSSSTSTWYVFDSARDSYNAVTKSLYPNLSNAEDTSSTPRVDFLSNGFKIVSGANDPNDTGTWIYFAVAESPFQYARAR